MQRVKERTARYGGKKSLCISFNLQSTKHPSNVSDEKVSCCELMTVDMRYQNGLKFEI
jgi:hypothetical protein